MFLPRHKITYKKYQQIHHWLKKNFGRADKCEGEDCNQVSHNFQWALIKGKSYEEKRESFRKLCRSCHAKEDMTEEGRARLGDARRGKPCMSRTIICFLCKKKVTVRGSCPKSCTDCRVRHHSMLGAKWAKLNKEKVRVRQIKYYQTYKLKKNAKH